MTIGRREDAKESEEYQMITRMNRKFRLIVIPLVITGALLLIAAILFPSLRLTLVEQITGNNPEARIERYVHAVLRGDEEAALKIWELPSWKAQESRSEALAERRAAITRELIRNGIQNEYLIRDTEWWRTCCEPSVICNGRAAGGARVTVQFIDGQGLPVSYIFDVFHRDGSYWGSAMRYPTRHWVLRDVYPSGDEPLYWRMVHQADVHHLPWPAE